MDVADRGHLRGNLDVTRASNSDSLCRGCSVAVGPKSILNQILRPITASNHVKTGRGSAGRAASFLLKVAILEAVRRLSKARCPVVWSGLQALQVLCYPPFKWIWRWFPFGVLVEGMQMLSRPLLVLSVATAFSDDSEDRNLASGGAVDSNGTIQSQGVSESHPEPPSTLPISTTRIGDEGSQALSSTEWLVQLYEEFKTQGITLPKRINEEELCRFYSAANGDFSCLLSSLKKTIYWRDTYRILPEVELGMWSNMVFWHGFDTNHRPCLVIRLGLACTSLPFDDRPRFAQAVVSQVEYGILHLVNAENPQITVLVDCEGLSPLRIPMQMIRSCSTLLQDHFPNRLGCLFVIRLPPVARVIVQTFLEVLKTNTRKKLKIEGDMYKKVLSECIQTLPSYLGGVCTCSNCARIDNCNAQHSFHMDVNGTESNAMNSNDDFRLPNPRIHGEMFSNVGYDHLLRTAVLCILMFSVLIAFLAGIYDS